MKRSEFGWIWLERRSSGDGFLRFEQGPRVVLHLVEAVFLAVVLNDAEREFDYTAGAERALELAARRRWTIVSMTKDRGHTLLSATGSAPSPLRCCGRQERSDLVGDLSGEANAVPMGSETRFERRLDRALARAGTPRGGAMIVAAITTAAAVGSGLLMTAVDHKDFATIGQGLWWAVQTVSTVGYGDRVPTNLAGQLVAALVMLLGLAFLAVITAAVTSSFVARATRGPTSGVGDAGPATVRDVRDINERLDRMEALLRAARERRG